MVTKGGEMNRADIWGVVAEMHEADVKLILSGVLGLIGLSGAFLGISPILLASLTHSQDATSFCHLNPENCSLPTSSPLNDGRRDGRPRGDHQRLKLLYPCFR